MIRQNSNDRGYNYQWQQAREVFLKLNPLCIFHKERDEVVAATIVDHIKPHNGDKKLFWDRSNWQSLCKECHDSLKQAIEKDKGHPTGLDGWPIESASPT